jgi:dienelactone hydrolase
MKTRHQGDPAAVTLPPWDLPALQRVPETFPAPGFSSGQAQPLFFAGLPWRGKPTRVFAWLGLPSARAEKVPGIVLVHGGGGTAFAEWVSLWTSRGYAAIAMDVCGHVPQPDPDSNGAYGVNWSAQPDGGPPGWDASFAQTGESLHDQWPYHAVAGIMLAHSLLAAQPGVDGDRIGVTGVSWGGFLTCLASGVDARLKFAAPVYGCGFLGEDSAWLPSFEAMGEEKAEKWLGQWDPSLYLPRARMPFLWVTGTNDFAYPLNSLQRSYRLIPPDRNSLCIRVRMPHGHGGAGEAPAEIAAFADAIVRGGEPLARLFDLRQVSAEISTRFESTASSVHAEVNFTRADHRWADRHWETAPAKVDTEGHRISATLPGDATVAYLNLVDARGRVASTEHIEMKS